VAAYFFLLLDAIGYQATKQALICLI